jgi:ribosomal protein S18 acetylase RimI-like enzyme
MQSDHDIDENIVRRMTSADLDTVIKIYLEVVTSSYLSFTELADGTAAEPGKVSERASTIIRKQLLEKLQSSDYALFVLTRDRIVGFAVAELRHTAGGHIECWLEDLGVRPQWRHQGIGKRLVQHVLEWGRLHNTRYFLLESGVNNEDAHRLFSKLGFQPLSKVFWRGP